MRRRYVSEEDLNQVVRLKTGGASWLRIEKETGLPRRTAKRAYEEWEQAKSAEELKSARMAIAEDEFRVHLNDLVSMAQVLVDSLHVPMPMGGIGDVEGVFDRLWRKSIRDESRVPAGEKNERRTVRQNRMLFDGLQEHARGVVRWEALEEWKQAYTRYREVCEKLSLEAAQIVRNVLAQRRELKELVEDTKAGNGVVEMMVTGIVEAVWRGLTVAEDPRRAIGVRTGAEGRWVVSFGEHAWVTVLELEGRELTAVSYTHLTLPTN